MRRVGTVVRAGRARRWTRPLFLGIASLSLALVVAAGCTPVKPTPPIDTPDTAAPGAPSTPDLAASSDTGVSSTDNITNDTAPTFAGTAEAGSTVKLLEGDTEIGSGTATGGAYNVTTSALAEGDHTITATATDPANNTSPASSGLVVTIDVTAPAGPSTPVLDALSDSGTPADGITSDNTPTVTGTAVADATVTIHDGGTAVGSAPATGGNYSVVTSALPDGDRAISATASDVAGNPSAASAPLVITIDTSAPVVSITTPANGAVTNDNTPALSGVAENAQVTVSIYAGPTPSGTPVQTLTPLATSGAWAQDAGALADGVYTAQATQGDTAGNVGTSSANTFTVDTVAPLAPSTPDLDAASDTGTSNTDDVTSDTTPTFTGTAEADSLVRILADGIEVGSGTATGGNYNITTSTLTDDIYTITATATDGADNPSAASAGLQVMIDSTLPAAPSTPDLDAGSDTGTSSADENTSDTTPTFTGTAENGSTVRIFAGLTEVGSGIATGGNYSITTSVLADGVHSITATATDVAGTSPASGALAVTIDTTDPTVAVVAPADDAVTNDDTPEVSGTAGLDSTVTVEIYAGVDTLGTLVETLTPTAAGGLWSGTATTLADAEYTVVATQTDAAGNTGTSAANTFTVDTTAPAAPSTPNLDAGSDTGTSDTDNITNDNTPTFTGTAVEGSLVRILADGVEVGSGTANGGASYSITTSVLTDDVYDITATATDAANNTSGPSGLLEVTIDSNVPAAPSTPDLLTGSDTGASDTDDITSDDTPTFTGTAEPGSTVRILEGLTEVGSGTATGGTYSITTSGLSDDVHSITATATDVAGTSPPSGALSVTIDTTDPTVAVVAPADGAVTNDNTPELSGTASDAAVVTVTVYPGSDTSGSPVETLTPTAAGGSVDTTDPSVAVVAPANGAVTNDDTPSVSGTATLDSTVTVEIYAGSDTSGALVETLTPTATGGLWSDTATTLANGEYTVEATQTDAAGNTGTSTANTFTVDTTAPGAPSTPDLDAASDTGTSSTDDVTSDTTPTFTGTAEAGSLVRILADGVEVGSGTATGGNYSITTSALTDDEYDFTATATDAASNTSAPSGDLEVTIDTTVPAAPSTPDLDNGSDSGVSDTDDITSDDTPTFTGTAAPGSLVRISANGVEVGSGTATGGNYSITTSTLTNSDFAITATATDVVGTSPPSDALLVTIDTTEPAVTVISPADNSSTSDDTPLLEGTADDGLVTVTIYEGPDTTGTVNQTRTPTAASGLWSDTATMLPDGEYTIEATQTDVAGNTGTSTASTFTVNPALVPGISGTVTNPGGTPVESLQVLIVTVTGALVQGTVTDASGNYSVALADGDYKVAFFFGADCVIYFDDQTSLAEADVVSVTGAPVTDVDAESSCATISGQVTNASGDLLANVAVGVFDSDENLLAFQTTNPLGNYELSVFAGARKVAFQDLSATYASEWYDDAPSFEDALVLDLAPGDSETADAVLSPGSGTITGNVTGDSAIALPGVQVAVLSPYNEFPIASTTTDADGDYTVAVSASDYKVRFSIAGCNEYYDDEPDFASADVVTVAPDDDVTANEELDCSTISGTITDAGGALRGVPIQIFEAGSSSQVATATTDSSGHYDALVGDGDYKIVFGFPDPDQCGEFYADKTDLASADVVTVTGVDVVANAELTNCATISGTVTSAGGAPVAGLFMPLRDAAGNVAGATATDASGHYTHLVTPGDYKVEFGFSHPCGEFYDNKATEASADVVSIANGGRVTADAQLSCLIISGTVTGPTGDPLSPVGVHIYTAADTPVASMVTDASGDYSRLVAPGDYKIQFDLGGGCGEWYEDKPDQASADVVSANATDVTANAALPCDEPLQGEISGTITNCSPCTLAIELYTTSGTLFAQTNPDEDGHYSFQVQPGDYKIRFAQFGACGPCAEEWYDDKPDLASADVVHVTDGGTVTADAEIEFEGGI